MKIFVFKEVLVDYESGSATVIANSHFEAINMIINNYDDYTWYKENAEYSSYQELVKLIEKQCNCDFNKYKVFDLADSSVAAQIVNLTKGRN